MYNSHPTQKILSIISFAKKKKTIPQWLHLGIEAMLSGNFETSNQCRQRLWNFTFAMTWPTKKTLQKKSITLKSISTTLNGEEKRSFFFFFRHFFARLLSDCVASLQSKTRCKKEKSIYAPLETQMCISYFKCARLLLKSSSRQRRSSAAFFNGLQFACGINKVISLSS